MGIGSISSGWAGTKAPSNSAQASRAWSDRQVETQHSTKAIQERRATDDAAKVGQNWPAAQNQWSSMGNTVDTYM
jgi:hypothetical protein